MEDVPCTYRVSIKAIIRDADGRVLLLQEKDNTWELPGGGMEHGETPTDALARELAEETGYSMDRMGDRPTAFWAIRGEVGSPTLKWFAFVAYEVTVSGVLKLNPSTTDEAQEAKYFTVEEAKMLSLHINTQPYFSKD